MLHPNQFQVNDAWIVFKLNDAPIFTESDGDFDLITLMDAASCFVVSSAPKLSSTDELSRIETERLLMEGKSHKNQLPKTLFVPEQLPAQHLTAEAESHGIAVVQVPEDQLLPFIGEVRQVFKERFHADGAE